MTKKRVAILGSTGSIGTQTLEIIQQQKDFFTVEVLTAQQNASLLIEQARIFHPSHVVIANADLYPTVKDALKDLPIKVLAGQEALAEVVQLPSIDIVLTALVGYAGLLPTIEAIKKGKTIALANKETLVVAGALINTLLVQYNTSLYPVDSEHSAIFQCLVGEAQNPIEKIILTASGGPFRGKKTQDLLGVTKAQALKHPNWSMGAKITIDSASLMNKGLEVIEAKWLFGLQNHQIEVIVHPQSIVHSLVQFTDGSIKAQMGLPDMQLPIVYALSYPQRLKNQLPRFDFSAYPSLTFEAPDMETFRNLALAYEAMRQGGNMPCVLNAANEVAVEKFLKDEIQFLAMPDLIADCMAKVPFIAQPTYEDYVKSDQLARQLAYGG